MDTILFVVASIVVAILIRVLSKRGGGPRESIRAAVERATAVPPPMTTGHYAAPTHTGRSSGHTWPAQPPTGLEALMPSEPPMHSWPTPPPPGPPLGPPPQPPAQHRPPPPQVDLDTRVRELMDSKNEVGAVRLLCDEAHLGIIDAQEYARRLVGSSVETAAAPPEEERDLGSAAFATSIFETGEDEGWASGWTDTPEPEDRSDIDELWQNVRSGGNQTGDGT